MHTLKIINCLKKCALTKEQIEGFCKQVEEEIRVTSGKNGILDNMNIINLHLLFIYSNPSQFLEYSLKSKEKIPCILIFMTYIFFSKIESTYSDKNIENYYYQKLNKYSYYFILKSI